MKSQERKARQQLNPFVLRQGQRWPSGKKRWTQTHFNWLESIQFEHPWLQVVLQEYVDSVKAATQRVNDLTEKMMRALPAWSLAPVVESLVALRAIDKLAATVLLCGRYRQLTQAGKNVKLVCVAIARELVGFIWDTVRQTMPGSAGPQPAMAG